LTLQIVLIITSIMLALFVLLHKGRGGGLSDLFGGGMSTSMGGKSVAERNLDKLTVSIGAVWVVCVLGLLALYRYAPEVGWIGESPTPTTSVSATATDDGAIEIAETYPVESLFPSDTAAAETTIEPATSAEPTAEDSGAEPTPEATE
jgi:preprotein translocase subunit SecG